MAEQPGVRKKQVKDEQGAKQITCVGYLCRLRVVAKQHNSWEEATTLEVKAMCPLMEIPSTRAVPFHCSP